MKKKILLFSSMLACTALQAQNAYINKVYDFCPAPGQNVNTMPQYNAGDTKESILERVNAKLCKESAEMISLGGYGGYVVFGFDHRVENQTGKMDFEVLGNAFFSTASTSSSRRGGSSEPGIILVSQDTNGNGLPDDEWYEIAGSEYNKPETIHDYEITYYRPDENKTKTPDGNFLSDTTYVRWTDNHGGKGYVYKNTFHSQSYWPQWLSDSTLTFRGTRLADNYVDQSGNGSYYVLYCYDYGYADNVPNDDSLAYINIDWAVDSNGHPAHLDGIDFVKVYTAVNQYCGWIGETSTEVAGAVDLHLIGQSIDDPTTRIYLPSISSVQDSITGLFDLSGRKVALPVAGRLYLVKANGKTRKVIWK